MTTFREVIDWLNARTIEYNRGEPTVEDSEWDDVYFKLKQAEEESGLIYPDSPTQTIVYEVVNELNKVTHNHKMLSLDKTKNLDDLASFLKGKESIAMCKMDGLTCTLKYNNGELIGAETRGNGLIGEDILHNALVIPTIPKFITYKGELVVDGEIYCNVNTFFEEFSKDYKNPRNFASGSIRLLSSLECSSRKLSFMAWELITETNFNTFEEKLSFLKALGFDVVPYVKCETSNDLDTPMVMLNSIKRTRGLPTDGIVFKFNDLAYGKAQGETSHHFKDAIAFKFYDEMYETKMKNIEWTMGRTGVLTPVAVFEPIDIEDSIVERASLHNVSVMYSTLGGGSWVGQEVKVFKANMIIPQIAEADHMPPEGAKMIPMPDHCPVCGGEVKIVAENDSKFLVCLNPQCSGKLINRLDHFCGKKGLDIKGISKATLEKLLEWDFVRDIEDIFNLREHREDWIKKPGFGVKSVDKILDAIEIAKFCSLNAFISAIGIPLIGATASKDLAKTFNTWNDFIEAVENKFEFSSLKNFGSEMENAILSFDYTQAKEIAKHIIIGISFPATIKEDNSNLDGKTFVITGKLTHYKNRDALKEEIEPRGGKVTSAISKSTSYLINNDSTSSSSKNISAQKYGISIITEDEFINQFINNK